MAQCRRGPLVLTVLDGWGVAPDGAFNAVTRSGVKNYPEWLMRYPNRTLVASGEAVGLPEGQMGNSEVGHLTLGAGRVLYQELPRISRDIHSGAFFDNRVLKAACAAAKDSTLHLMGLLSDGGVHSHIEHLKGMVELARREGVSRVAIHAILDGRDTPPESGAGYLENLQDFLKTLGTGAVATAMGRYWAMDRDQRWDRVEKAYRAFVLGEAERVADGVEAVRASYCAGVTDEFMNPVTLGLPYGTIRDGDSVVFFNFRADRAREISRALTEEHFAAFPRAVKPAIALYTTFTRYHKDFPFAVAFETAQPRMTLGEVLAGSGLKQLRIAETEKYAHVTFFFNGGQEVLFDGEERILVPSPKVATYDQKPSMSAVELTDALLERLGRGGPDFVLLNFANPDMVGHTGYFEAACEAARTVDVCMGRIVPTVLEKGGALCVIADHGNFECMREADGVTPHTAHTTNPVPFIWIGPTARHLDLDEPRGLASVAPTLLEWLGLPVPPEMDAPSLWVK
jgi:2,3-bisphosphoglycerate-independent phosphoglycerate mutase